MKKREFIFALISIFALCSVCFAGNTGKDSEVFPLIKTDSGHYIFRADLNNRIPAAVLLESGIPALLIDSAFVFENLDRLDIRVEPCTESNEINLGGKKYDITHKAKGDLHIGSVVYKGEIFVLAHYAGKAPVAVPIQNLFNPSDDDSRIVKLDLANRRLQMLARKNVKKMKLSGMELNTDTYLNMPAVKTTFRIADKEKSGLLDGNFNLDLGNPSFLFLFKQNKNVQRFLSDHPDIGLQKAYNKKGKEIAEVFRADKCQLGGLYFHNVIIGIIQELPRFTTEGNIGLNFFKNMVAVFDFDRNGFYYRQNDTNNN